MNKRTLTRAGEDFFFLQREYLSRKALLLVAFCIAFVPRLSHAGSATWSATPASGSWNSAGNWNPATIPNDPTNGTDVATFGTSNTTAVTITTNITLDGIVFNPGASAYTITVANSGELSLFFNDVTNNSGTTQNFVVSGSGGLLRLFTSGTADANTTYTVDGGGVGSISVHGSLEISTLVGSSNFIANSGSVANSAGGQIAIGSGTLGSGTYTLNGGTTASAGGGSMELDFGGDGGNATIIATSGTNGGYGATVTFKFNSTGDNAVIQMSGNSSMDISADTNTTVSIGSLQGSGNVFLGARYLITGTNNLSTTFSGTIQSTAFATGGLTKIGTGTFTLSGSNTYSGTTTVSAGALLVNGFTGTSSPVMVSAGATLGGSGNAQGAVTVAGGANFIPGSGTSAGTLTVGSLTLNSTSQVSYFLGQPGVVGGGSNSLTIVNGNLTLDGTLGFLNTVASGTYRLFNYSGTLTDNTLNIAATGGNATTQFSINTATGNQVRLIVAPGNVWLASPTSGDWNTAANWSAGTVPNSGSATAFFSTSGTTAVATTSGSTEVNSIVFIAGASAYTITVSTTGNNINNMTISGTGIINNSGTTQNFLVDVAPTFSGLTILNFDNSATAGSNIVIEVRGSHSPSPDTQGSHLNFFNNSTSGSAIIINDAATTAGNSGGETLFDNSTSAGNATITNKGGLLPTGDFAFSAGFTEFNNSSTAANAVINNQGSLSGTSLPGFTQWNNNSSSGSATITNSGGTFNGTLGGAAEFLDDSTASHSIINNNAGTVAGAQGGSTNFNLNTGSNGPTAGNAAINNFGSGTSGAGGGITIFGQGFLGIAGAATAGNAVISNFGASGSSANGGATQFFNQATAGSSTIHDFAGTVNGAPGGNTQFFAGSTAGNSTIVVDGGTTGGAGGGLVNFSGSATGGNAVFTVNGSTSVALPGSGLVIFNGPSTTSGSAAFTLNGGFGTGSGTTPGGGEVEFLSGADAGNSTFALNSGTGGATQAGNVYFSGSSTAASGSFHLMGGGVGAQAGGLTVFDTVAKSGSAIFTLDGGTVTGAFGASMKFSGTSSADHASITLNGPTVSGAASGNMTFQGSSTAGSGTITANGVTIDPGGNTSFQGGEMDFLQAADAGSATLIANSGSNNGKGALIQFSGSSTGGTARIVANGNGTMSISGLSTAGLSVGSIEGSGSFVLGAKSLTTGALNTSTTVSGIIAGSSGSLIKMGSGTLTLGGVNTYTGSTILNAGGLKVNGSLAAGSAVLVNSGATLSGTGNLQGAVTIAGGGNFAPGNSPGTITVGSLTLNSTSQLNYELATAGVVGGGVNDLTIVNGALVLDGTLNVTDAGGFSSGTYELMTYSGSLTNNTLNIGTVPAGFLASQLAIQTGSGLVDLIVSGSGGGGGATWLASPSSGDWNTGANWTSGTAPNSGISNAVFATSGSTSVSLSANVTVNAIVFNAGGSAFTITVPATGNPRLTISGTGIVNNSGTAQNFVTLSNTASNLGEIFFTNSASAGVKTIFTNNAALASFAGETFFFDFSSAGNSTILNLGGVNNSGKGGLTSFTGSSQSGTATITNYGGTVSAALGGSTEFHQASSADHGIFITNGGASSGALGGVTKFFDTATAGSGSFTTNGASTSGGFSGTTQFTGTSTAGNGTFITNSGTVFGGLAGVTQFIDISNAGHGVFTTVGTAVAGGNTGQTLFSATSSAASGTFTNNGGTISGETGGFTGFNGSSTGANGVFINDGGTVSGALGGATQFGLFTTSGSATITNNGGAVSGAFGGNTQYFVFATAGSGTINNLAGSGSGASGGFVQFNGSSDAGTAIITNSGGSVNGSTGGFVQFSGSSSANHSTITNQGATATTGSSPSITQFFDASTAGSAQITNDAGAVADAFAGGVQFSGTSSAGTSTITSLGGGFNNARGGATQFTNNSTAGSGTITADGGTVAGGRGAETEFRDSSSAGSATLIANGGTSGGGGASLFFVGTAGGGTARVVVNGNAYLDMNQLTNGGMGVGSIEGSGSYYLGGNALTTGDNNLSTTVSGVIQDGASNGGGGTGGSLIKIGSGTLTLSGSNTYTGSTVLNAGGLKVNGSLAAGSTVVINAGTLSGTGNLGAVTIANNAALAPGNSPGTITVGSLTLSATSQLNYELATAGVVGGGVNDLTVVNGNLTLDGVLNVTDAGGFGVGTYRLFNYTGSLTDNTLNIGTVPGGFTAGELSIQSGSGQVNLIVTGSVVAGGGATWLSSPSSGDWNTGANWTGGTAPNSGTSTAFFATSGSTHVSLSAATTVNSIVFNPGASAFTIAAPPGITLTISGTGVVNNSAVAQNFTLSSNSSHQSSALVFNNGATAGANTVYTVDGGKGIGDFGSAITFNNTSTAGSGTFTLNGGTAFVTLGGTIAFNNSSTAGNGTFNLGGGTADSASGAFIFFHDSSSAGNGIFTIANGTVGNSFGGEIDFSGSSTAENATITANGASATGGPFSEFINFDNNATAGNATVIANSGTGGGGGGAITFNDNSTGGTATIKVFGNGQLDISAHNAPGVAVGSIEGDGSVFLGADNLATGTNNKSTTFSGTIQDGGFNGGTGGSLTKTGTGTLTLTGPNTYTGGTVINGGDLLLGDGSTTGASLGSGTVSVNPGGTFTLNLANNEVFANNIVDNSLVVLDDTPVSNYSLSGIISGTGAVIKTGLNTVTLTGSNNYSGPTGVNGGILKAGSTTALSSNSAFHVAAGATLDINNFTNTIGSLADGAGGGGTVTNSGSSHTPLFVGNDNTSTSYSGALTGNLVVHKSGTGTFTLTGSFGNSGFDVSGGALIINGTTAGGVQVDNSTFGGNATIGGDLNNNGIVSPGNSPGTINVAGNYFQSSNGRLVIQIAGLGAGQHDLLAVTGSASLNGTLQLVRLNNFNANAGDKLTFLSSGSGVSGTFSNVDTGSILGVKVVYDSNDVMLTFTQGSFAQFALFRGLTPNQNAVARNLDLVIGDPRASLLINFLDNQPLGNLPFEFDEIAPDELSAIYQIDFASAQIQQENLEDRMRDIRNGSTGFSSALYVADSRDILFLAADGKSTVAPSRTDAFQPGPDNKWGMFISGNGDFVNVDGNFNARGYDFTTGGITLGADYRVNRTLALGVALDYAHTSTTLTNDGLIDADGAKLGIFGTWFQDGCYLNSYLGGGYNTFDTRRTALLGQAQGNTDGGEFDTFFSGGYDMHRGPWTFGPIGSFDYTYAGFGAFTENGSLAPLRINSQGQDSFRSTLGWQGSYSGTFNGTPFTPRASASWQHEYAYSSLPIDSQFASGAGPVFRVDGPATARDSALFEAGVNIQLKSNINAYLNYNAQVNDTYQSQSITGGVSISY